MTGYLAVFMTIDWLDENLAVEYDLGPTACGCEMMRGKRLYYMVVLLVCFAKDYNVSLFAIVVALCAPLNPNTTIFFGQRENRGSSLALLRLESTSIPQQ